MQFIDLSTQYQHFKTNVDRRMQTVLNHAQFIMGPEVAELEKQLANYVGVKNVISCANGTDALTLALMALGIGEGDGVLVPTFTFFASAETVAFAGATPVFVDSDPATFNICPKDLELKIQTVMAEGNLNLKAVMAVDLFGLPANYVDIKNISDRYGLKIIEDAAQGFGGEINLQKAGSFGDIATTSFFPAKPLGCYGDGGAIFTDNDDYAALIKSYREHGKGQNKYSNVRIGMNSRLDTIQAAVLLEKLVAFPRERDSRNVLAERYHDALSKAFATPDIPQGYLSSWAQYTLVSDHRDYWMQKLKEKSIPSNIYYGTCMHQQTAFKDLNNKDSNFPVAEKLAKTVFSLPMHPYMTEEHLQQITQVLLK